MAALLTVSHIITEAFLLCKHPIWYNCADAIPTENMPTEDNLRVIAVYGNLATVWTPHVEIYSIDEAFLDLTQYGVPSVDPQTGQTFRLSSGTNSSIRINKKEHSPDGRGLNIVVLNVNAQPIIYSFDTYSDSNPPGIPHVVLRKNQVITEMLKLRLRQLQNVWMSYSK